MAMSYLRMVNKTREQHSKVLNRTLKLTKNMNITTKEALEIARTEVFSNEPVINIYSMSSVHDVGYQKHEAIRHWDKPRVLSLQPKKFPTILKYLQRNSNFSMVRRLCY